MPTGEHLGRLSPCRSQSYLVETCEQHTSGLIEALGFFVLCLQLLWRSTSAPAPRPPPTVPTVGAGRADPG
jgi:hypothetical protein